ncbi:hypothetical protein ACE38V_10855 [Cytobacillus sp. Hz8]|uniref:hypothetical protein n=1 Tax=Cytobacillus sp. Hz8 TaxID=3347168 RepID=UPI0035D61EA6
MMILSMILPFMIILVFGLLIIWINSKVKLISGKVTYWLLIVYVGILLLSFVLVSTRIIQPIQHSARVTEDIKQSKANLIKALSKGKYKEVEEKYLDNKKSFDYQQKNLSLDSKYHFETVYVERKSVDDHKIEAYVYGSSLIVQNMNFYQSLKKLQFVLHGDTLKLTYPQKQDLKFSIFKVEFPISQFKEKTKLFDDDSVQIEQPIVYLRIPKGLTIKTDLNVYYQNVIQ